MNHHPQSELAVWTQSIRVEDCRQCVLHKDAQTVCLLGDGPVPCEGMIVGDAPGSADDKNGIPFSGPSGIFLRKMLKEVGFDPRQLYFAYTTGCRPPANREPKAKEMQTCSALYLRPQLELVKPRAILLLGNMALRWALGKKGAITKMEGSTFTLDGFTCVPSRSPSAVMRVKDYDFREYQYVLQKFRENLLRFHRVLHPVEDKFPYEKNWSVVRNLKIGEVIYTDIETDGLNPFRDKAKIHCVGACNIPSRVMSKGPLVEDDFPIVQKMLREHPIMAQGGTFEGTWYYYHYGILPLMWYDTRLGYFVQNENDTYELKSRAVRMLNVEPWDEEQNWENPDFKKLLPYNARDNQYGLRLFREHDIRFFKNNPKVARLMRYILCPAEEVFIKVICRGVHIDMDQGKKRLKQCAVKKKELNDQINEIAGYEVNPGSPKQMSKIFYDQLRFDCPVKTSHGANSTSEAALIRLKLQYDHPIIDALWAWRGWDKNESTYLLPWTARGPVLHFNYGFTNTDTGRLNSTSIKDKRGQKKVKVPCIFCVVGKPSKNCLWCEGTGIITCGLGATAHQCPRDPFIRSIISPRGYSPIFDHNTRKWVSPRKPVKEDWCILEADLSQIELRLVAHASGDATMCDIFSHPASTHEGDIHYQTARELQPKGEIDKETRKKAKAVNFGFVYGMMAKKFVIYALEKFDLKLSPKEGKDYRHSFFRKYNGLPSWHNRVEAFVTANGFIDSVFGRRRHLPSALHPSIEDCPDCLEDQSDNCFLCGGEGIIHHGESDEWIQREAVRQAINSPIQSAGSDLNLFIAALTQSRTFHEDVIPDWKIPAWDFKIDERKAFLVASAHDSQIYECRKDYVKELHDGIKYTVANLPLKKFFGFEFRVPIEMDCTAYSDCWKGKVMEI